MDNIGWGIIGTGAIAKKFAFGLSKAPGAELVAVGSRARQTADRFADEFDVPHRHASYETLAADGDVDVVYVATPHTFHKACSLLCLDAGKAVLCEKPFTINASEAEEVIASARKRKRFIMEGMWTRFFPAMDKLRELLTENVVGEIRMVAADFGFRAGVDPKARLFNPMLGGGALLDVGVYPVSLASMLLGPPDRIATLAHLGETGVDEQSGMLFGYEGGEIALLYTAVRTTTPHEAFILGTEGRIRIRAPWWKPSALEVTGKRSEVHELPFEDNGFQYEAAHVTARLRQGKLESDIMPLDETLSVMRTMDEVRSQWGLTYPMEK